MKGSFFKTCKHLMSFSIFNTLLTILINTLKVKLFLDAWNKTILFGQKQMWSKQKLLELFKQYNISWNVLVREILLAKYKLRIFSFLTWYCFTCSHLIYTWNRLSCSYSQQEHTSSSSSSIISKVIYGPTLLAKGATSTAYRKWCRRRPQKVTSLLPKGYNCGIIRKEVMSSL